MNFVSGHDSRLHSPTSVLNGDNVGPVTLFRVYPPGVDTFTIKDRERTDASFEPQLLEYNRLNRKVFERVQHEALAGRGVVISMTDGYRKADYGAPIAALKSYVLSPFTTDDHMNAVLQQVLAARDAVLAESNQQP